MSESLLSAKRVGLVKDALWENNPISFQILGICSALAVTVQVKTAIVMVLALTFVLCLSNVVISLIRSFIPTSIRIIVFLSVISTLVILIDQVLKAYMFNMSKQLSVFVGLIITNCIVMGRAEAFAMGHSPWEAFLDGLGNSMGYGIYLIMVAVPRELLGSGKLMGYQIIPDAAYEAGYANAGIMVLAPGAFLLLGLFIWLQREFMEHKKGAR